MSKNVTQVSKETISTANNENFNNGCFKKYIENCSEIMLYFNYDKNKTIYLIVFKNVFKINDGKLIKLIVEIKMLLTSKVEFMAANELLMQSGEDGKLRMWDLR